MNTRHLAIGAAMTALVVALSLSAAIWDHQRKSWQLPAIAGIGGPFALVDHRGNAVTDKDFLNKPTLVFFGFTHCPDVCPTTLLDLTNRLNELGCNANRLNVLFITVDPERDTPEQLALYLSSFHRRITGLSGTVEGVAEAMRGFRAFARKVPLESGGYTMDHTASIYMLNRKGQFVGLVSYQDPEPTARLKIRQLLNDR